MCVYIYVYTEDLPLVHKNKIIIRVIGEEKLDIALNPFKYDLTYVK